MPKLKVDQDVNDLPILGLPLFTFKSQKNYQRKEDQGKTNADELWQNLGSMILSNKQKEEGINLDKIFDKRNEVLSNYDYVDKARTFGVRILNHGDHMHFKHKVDSYTGMVDDYVKNIDNPQFYQKTLNLKIKSSGRGKCSGPQSAKLSSNVSRH